MGRRLGVNTKNTDCDELTRLARKCGFVVFHGGRHDKVKTRDGRTVTTIPRKNKIKRETAKGIVEQFVLFGAEIEIN